MLYTKLKHHLNNLHPHSTQPAAYKQGYQAAIQDILLFLQAKQMINSKPEGYRSYHQLAGDGEITFGYQKEGNTFQRVQQEIQDKINELEWAMDELLQDLGETCFQETSPLQRLLTIREGEKRTSKKKSLYESMNQLIHYYFCLMLTQKLWESGLYEKIDVLPTHQDSNKKREGDIRQKDVEAFAKSKKEWENVIGEVFCVAASSLKSKLRKCMDDLVDDPRKAKKVIFCNQTPYKGTSGNAKRKQAMKEGLSLYGYEIKTRRIEPLSYMEITNDSLEWRQRDETVVL